jgi:hypothetical protein
VAVEADVADGVDIEAGIRARPVGAQARGDACDVGGVVAEMEDVAHGMGSSSM